MNIASYLRHMEDGHCHCDDCRQTSEALAFMNLQCRNRAIIHGSEFGPVTISCMITLLEDAALNLVTRSGAGSCAQSMINTIRTIKDVFDRAGERVYAHHCDKWLETANALTVCCTCKGKGSNTEYTTVETVAGDYDEPTVRRCDDCHGTGRLFYHYRHAGEKSLLIVYPKRPKYPPHANRNMVPDIDVGVDVGAFLGILPAISIGDSR